LRDHPLVLGRGDFSSGGQYNAKLSIWMWSLNKSLGWSVKWGTTVHPFSYYKWHCSTISSTLITSGTAEALEYDQFQEPHAHTHIHPIKKILRTFLVSGQSVMPIGFTTHYMALKPLHAVNIATEILRKA